MNLDNTSPRPINTFTPIPIGPPPTTTPLAPVNPLPSYPMPISDPSIGIPKADLPNKQITPITPDQLPKNVETVLDPARILLALSQSMQGMGKPKADSTPEPVKNPAGQRDEAGAGKETSGKEGAGKGENLVNIQVFDAQQSDKNLNQNAKNENTSGKEVGKSADGSDKSGGVSEKGGSSAKEATVKLSPEANQQPSGEVKSKNSEANAAPPASSNNEMTSQSKGSLNSESTIPSPENNKLEKSPANESDKGLKTLGDSGTKEVGKEQPKEIAKSPGQDDPGKTTAENKKPVEESNISKQSPIADAPIDKPPEIIQQMQVEKPRNSPEQLAEKDKNKEQIESVQRNDKYQEIDHPAGHRVLEHGNVDNRNESAAAQAEGAHAAAHAVDADAIIPAWIAVMFTDQQDADKVTNQLKGGSRGRSQDLVEHRLSDILFMLLAASVCGAKSISDYIKFIQSHEKWFKVILGPYCQLPPKELTWKILSSLNPMTFEQPLHPWLTEICGGHSVLKNQEGKPVLSAISLWQSPLGLLIGQSKGSDPHLDGLAIGCLLSLFDFNDALVIARPASNKYDAAGYLSSVGADFIVEIEDDDNIEAIEDLMETAIKKESPTFTKSESYIEGQDRIVIGAVAAKTGVPIVSFRTKASIKQVLKIQHQIISSSGSKVDASYYISGLLMINEGVFDLLRIEMPLGQKVAWKLNSSMPVVPIAVAMQRCHDNLKLFRNFAVELLQRSHDNLSLDEKIKLASSSGEELLKVLRRPV